MHVTNLLKFAVPTPLVSGMTETVATSLTYISLKAWPAMPAHHAISWRSARSLPFITALAGDADTNSTLPVGKEETFHTPIHTSSIA